MGKIEAKKMALGKPAKLAVIILTVAAMAVAGLTIAAITVNQNVPSSGTITTGPNIGVYSNHACTNPITSINWGSIEAGGNTSQTIYIENTGDTQMAPSITVGGWSPSNAGTYITITWPTLPAEIQPGASNAVAVTLTLTVSSSITGISSFSNSINITGTG